MTRNEMLVTGLDHKAMTGIEIGPWYNPIAPRANGWNTIIVDFASGDYLREKARTHNAASVRAAVDKVEDVDIVWMGQSLDKPLLELHPEGYDFLIASHVFEHLPDLMGFLQQLETVIKPTGIISLAMPDMRYCFDFFRTLSMTQDVLLAHREKRKRHSPETIFQVNAYQTWLDGKGAWLRGDRPDVKLVLPLKESYQTYLQDIKTAKKKDAAYTDAHAWVFVPSSFRLIILELNALGLINFRVRNLQDGGQGAEFITQLEFGRIELDDHAIEMERQRLLEQIVVELAARIPQAN